MQENSTNDSRFNALWRQIRLLFNLEIDGAKFIITEKLTLLVSSITFYAVVFVLCTCAVVFLSIAAATLLCSAIGHHWAYVIVASFYVVVAICVVAFKRRLIINPVARFLSSVIIDPPPVNDESTK